MSSNPYLIFLNDYGVPFYYFYIQPAVASLSTLFNLMTSIVLGCKELRCSNDRFFKYGLVNSTGATLASFICIFMFITKCGGSLCSITATHLAHIYTIYAVKYMTASYFYASAMVQIVYEVDAYLSFSGKFNWIERFSPFKICAFIFGWFFMFISYLLTNNFPSLIYCFKTIKFLNLVKTNFKNFLITEKCI